MNNAQLYTNKLEVCRYTALYHLYDLCKTYRALTTLDGVRMFPQTTQGSTTSQQKLMKDLTILQQIFRAQSKSFTELKLDPIDPGSDSNLATLASAIQQFQKAKSNGIPDFNSKFINNIKTIIQHPKDSEGVRRKDPAAAPAGNSMANATQTYSTAMTHLLGNKFNTYWTVPKLTDAVAIMRQQKYVALYEGLSMCDPPASTPASTAQSKSDQQKVIDQDSGKEGYGKKFLRFFITKEL